MSEEGREVTASEKDFRTLFAENKNKVTSAVPFVRSLGFTVTEVTKTKVHGRLPYRDDLVGDPETGVVASGVITTILDSLCGMSCGLKLNAFMPVATLDLRIDYMRPAAPLVDILAEAECYHATRSVCFTRAIAYQGERDRMIASAAAAFAITGRPIDRKAVT